MHQQSSRFTVLFTSMQHSFINQAKMHLVQLNLTDKLVPLSLLPYAMQRNWSFFMNKLHPFSLYDAHDWID